jgi:hypothetical protein
LNDGNIRVKRVFRLNVGITETTPSHENR